MGKREVVERRRRRTFLPAYQEREGRHKYGPPPSQDWVQIRILLSLATTTPASRICKVKKGPYRLQKKGGGGDREIGGGGGPLGITTTVTLGKKSLVQYMGGLMCPR